MTIRAVGVAVALAAVAGALLLLAAPSRAVPSYDDSISFLAAAGHLEDWEVATGGPLTVRSAADWRQFSRTDLLRPVDVVRGMGQRDLHPPLYPLLLGLWTWAVGTSLSGALLLNALLLGGTGAVVFVTLRDHLGVGGTRSALGAVLAASGPAALATGMEVRAYALAGLLAAVVLWTVATPRPLTARRAAALAGAGAALLLTHYSGIWVMAGAGLARLYIERPGTARGVASVALPVLAAPAVAVALFPAVFDQISRQAGQQRVTFAEVDLVERGTDVVVALGSFLVLGRPAIILATAALVVAGAAAWGTLRPDALTPERSARRAVGLVTATVLAGLCGAFLVGLVPDFAMASKYLAFAAAGIAVMVAVVLPGPRSAALGIVVVAVGVAASWSALTLILPRVDADPMRYDQVVVDSTSRGVVPRVVWHLPDDTEVAIGEQAALVEYLEDPRRAAGCVLYVSTLRHGGTEEGRAAVVDALPSAKELAGGFASIGPAWTSGC